MSPKRIEIVYPTGVMSATDRNNPAGRYCTYLLDKPKGLELLVAREAANESAVEGRRSPLRVEARVVADDRGFGGGRDDGGDLLEHRRLEAALRALERQETLASLAVVGAAGSDLAIDLHGRDKDKDTRRPSYTVNKAHWGNVAYQKIP